MFQVLCYRSRAPLLISTTIASAAYGMAVGNKDYDWSYRTVCFLRRLVILLTLGSDPPIKFKWS